MNNILNELKSEIVRLARKEIKTELAPAKRVTVAQRGLIADLRRQIDAMQKELAALKKAVPTPETSITTKNAPAGRFWITGKGVKALRTRLGLTQANFAKLAGVSSQAVVNWEGKIGKIGLRKSTVGKLQGLRGIGKRQAAEMLGAGKAEPAKGKARRKAGSTKKIKRFDLLKDLGKPEAGKVEPKAKDNSAKKSKRKKAKKSKVGS